MGYIPTRMFLVVLLETIQISTGELLRFQENIQATSSLKIMTAKSGYLPLLMEV